MVNGMLSAIVTKVIDGSKEGLIEVYIPNLMIRQKPSSSEEEESVVTDNKIEILNEEDLEDKEYLKPATGKITSSNSITARPSFSTESNHGEYLVPEIGDEVFVFFAYGEENTCYYTRWGPYRKAKLTNFGTIIEDEESFKDPENKHKLKVLLLTKTGHIIAFNDTVAKNGVLFKTSNGHKLKMEKNDSISQVLLETENKNQLIMDDTNKGLALKSTKGFKFYIDDVEDGIAIETPKGSKIILNDKDTEIQIVTSGGNGMVFDDKTNTITLNSNQDNYLVVPNKFTLECPNIDLGNGASQSFIFGQLFQALFNKHRHISSIPGTPTSNPIDQMSESYLSKITKSL